VFKLLDVKSLLDVKKSLVAAESIATLAVQFMAAKCCLDDVAY